MQIGNERNEICSLPPDRFGQVLDLPRCDGYFILVHTKYTTFPSVIVRSNFST